MLKDRNSSAIVAVSDIDRARTFYKDTLGLTPVPGGEQEDMLEFRTGDTRLTVYKSDFAGTNKANAVTWEMKGDLVDTVNDLRGKGVTFEQYDMPGLTYRDGIHEAGEVKLVWFKDPDGNILHLLDGM
jgi:catechol 2,3-dioxygenase-like lactoylglutathione lyase family enzyme